MSMKEILRKLTNRNPEIKELERQRKIQRIVEQKTKTSNERELEKYMNEEREEQIKEKLKEYRERRKIKNNRNPLDTPNKFQDSDFEILKDKKLFSEHKDVLKQKYLFGG
jgi:hypothetical protein